MKLPFFDGTTETLSLALAKRAFRVATISDIGCKMEKRPTGMLAIWIDDKELITVQRCYLYGCII
jgi:hypothetical protein